MHSQASRAGDAVFDPKADSPLSDNALRNKKNRYAGFDANKEVARIIEESLGVGIKGMEPLGTGANAFDHIVFRVYTTDKRVVVCRINADKLPARYFPVEAALYTAWRTAGISSPAVYSVALRDNPVGFDYMLLENVGTTDLEKYLAQYPADEYAYARASGTFLARLHVVPVSGFGMLTLKAGSLVGGQTTWKEALHIRLEETLEYLLQHQLLSNTQAAEIYSAIARNDELLTFGQSVTLHGDYHDANIIIDEEHKSVVAAIDLSQAKAGDPVFDIAFYRTYVSAEKFDAFCEGYFSLIEKPRYFDKKLALYQLRIYLSKAKLRKRFGYEERIPAAIEGIVRSLEKLA